MTRLSLTLLPLLAFSLTTQASNDSENLNIQSHILAEAWGDLDKDGQPEKALLLDVAIKGQNPALRMIQIFKGSEDEWQLWHVSQGGVLDSESGGLLGDPFESMTIERGALVIRHFGGSAQKWNYTHRYRFDGKAWPLIGATIKYGTQGCYQLFDYNLASGKAVHKQVSKQCWSDDVPPSTTTQLNIDKPKHHDLDSFTPGFNQLTIQQLETTIYY